MTLSRTFVALLAAGLVLVLQGATSSAHSLVQVFSEDFYVAAGAPGVRLFVRNKRPTDSAVPSPAKIVVFVHGAGFPSESNFDLALDGWSWMDFVAERGWDVYAMDIRGYGRSTRPPAMDAPPENNPPFAGNDEAVADIGSVVDAILSRRGAAKLSLIGWSWGAGLVGAYTANHGDKVARVVLYAPGWIPNKLPDLASLPRLGAFRVTDVDEQLEDYDSLPADRHEEIYPRAWFDAWWAAQLASDPVGSRQTPPVVRAPNGVRADFRNYSGAGRPYYEPERIAVPTLVVLGEWDTDTPPYMAQAIFARLSHAPHKRLEVLGEGSHMMLVQKSREALFGEVQRFLDEEP